MAREIKFRAWYKYYKKMVDVLSIDFINKKLYIEVDKKGNPFGYINFDDCELMQLTGIKDKSGVDIYEGDILKTKYGGTGIVKWQKESVMFRYYKITGLNEYGEIVKFVAGTEIFYHGAKEFEVIGNIHANHELLEVQS